jgi:molybdopterin molybdotransferase
VPEQLIDPDEACRRVLARVAPLPAEEVALDDALGRVLAVDVRSPEHVPGFDNSAMDGYAVIAADTAGAGADRAVSLEVVDESRAGRPATTRVSPGAAIRISTGAMVPAGADAVVRVEDTAERDGAVDVVAEVEPGRNVRRSGEDVVTGETVLERGAALGPAELGVLASVGAAEIACARRPRVAVLTTGDELLSPSEPLSPGGVRDTNSHAVPAQARLAGAQLILVETVPDEYAATVAAIRRGLEADVLVICGGVSVGPHDHVKPALAELGVEQDFWGVALRPGKPTWFGVHEAGGRRCLVFGLPGNPVSAMVTFHLFARPALAAMTGIDASAARFIATIDEDYAKRPGRMHAVRCRLEARDDGWHVRPTKEQGSHVLTSMLGAQALALVETDRGDVRAGERVEVELLRP